jgi:drug/metabolite transporter (DMT)-like permease
MTAKPKQPGAKVARLPVGLALGLFLAIVLDTALQAIWKRAALALPANALTDPLAAASSVLHQPMFLLVGLLIALLMVNWLKVLDDADVSFALPITALSYVSVAGVSAIWLGEALTLGKALGVALILGGVYLVSRTDYKTGGEA